MKKYKIIFWPLNMGARTIYNADGYQIFSDKCGDGHTCTINSSDVITFS